MRWADPIYSIPMLLLMMSLNDRLRFFTWDQANMMRHRLMTCLADGENSARREQKR